MDFIVFHLIAIMRCMAMVKFGGGKGDQPSFFAPKDDGQGDCSMEFFSIGLFEREKVELMGVLDMLHDDFCGVKPFATRFLIRLYGSGNQCQKRPRVATSKDFSLCTRIYALKFCAKIARSGLKLPENLKNLFPIFLLLQ